MPPEELEDVVIDESQDNVEESTDVADQSDDTVQEGEVEEEATEDADGSEGDSDDEGGASGDEEDAEGGEEVSEEDEVDSKLTFKAGVYNKETKSLEQKEFQIDPKFKSLMKDPEGEKLVRELHEKAYGLESVKERYNETRQIATEMATENKEIKHQLGKLGQTYRSAVQSGNLHKLDGFFEQMQIPQEVIMQYAIAKAELQEMDPSQRQAIEGRLSAERQAEHLAEQQARTDQQYADQETQIKQLQMESLMARPDISTMASSFDERLGKPGAFQAEVVRTGQLAWFQRRQNLSPEQAMNEVIRMHNLKAQDQNQNNQNGNQNSRPGNGNGSANKQVIIRNGGAKTLPNVQGRTASPLKQKPKSIEDLNKIRKELYGN